MGNIAALIPAYRSDGNMLSTVSALIKNSVRGVLVNDGGGEQYDELFLQAEEKGATVLHHAANQGKALNRVLIPDGKWVCGLRDGRCGWTTLL